MKRSSEEIENLECEMDNTLHYFESKRENTRKAIESITLQEDKFARGALALLYNECTKIERQITVSKMLFSCKYPTSFPIESDGDDSEDDSDGSISDTDIEDNWVYYK